MAVGPDGEPSGLEECFEELNILLLQLNLGGCDLCANCFLWLALCVGDANGDCKGDWYGDCS